MRVYKNKDTTCNQYRIAFAGLIFCFFLLITAGCGGGGGGGDGDGGSGSPGSRNDVPWFAVILTWDAPTTNSDGTPLTDLAGYKVYYGLNSGNYTYSLNNGSFTGVSISDLATGTWCFAVTSYDISGNESELSDELCTFI